jgi:hypothetical protein
MISKFRRSRALFVVELDHASDCLHRYGLVAGTSLLCAEAMTDKGLDYRDLQKLIERHRQFEDENG